MLIDYKYDGKQDRKEDNTIGEEIAFIHDFPGKNKKSQNTC